MNKKLEKVMQEKAHLYLTEGRGVNISDLSEEIKGVIFKDGYKKAIESNEVHGLVEALEHCRPYMMDMVEEKIVNKALANFKGE